MKTVCHKVNLTEAGQDGLQMIKFLMCTQKFKVTKGCIKDIEYLEKIQHWATILVPELRNLEYSERL